MPILSNVSSSLISGLTYKSSAPDTTKFGSNNADNLAGSDANDTLYGLGGNDWLYGSFGNDTLDGGSGDDLLIGWEGSDTLKGGDGDDRLYGDYGPDTYLYWHPPATDYLYGGAGNDYLDGGAGADVMFGGSGNDTYVVDDAGDSVNEQVRTMKGFVDTGGIDEVRTTLDQYTLGANVENLTFILKNSGNVGFGNDLDNVMTGAAGDDQLQGGNGNDTLIGNAGNDELSGDAGEDAMIGGTGNDVYAVDNAGDQVIERAGEGTDTVLTSLSEYTLGDDVENLIGGANAGMPQAFRGVGNDLDNIIVGMGGDDTLEGGAGNDTLYGDFELFASASTSNDRLVGGSGNDILKGGGGADTYVFADGDTGSDRIIGFNEVEGDVLDFSGMTGVTDFSSLTISSDADGNAVVSYGDTSVTLEGVNGASLDGSEFVFAPQDPAMAGGVGAEEELALVEAPAPEAVEEPAPIAVDEPDMPVGFEEPGHLPEDLI